MIAEQKKVFKSKLPKPAAWAQHAHDVLGDTGEKGLARILAKAQEVYGHCKIDMYDLRRRTKGLIKHTASCGCPVPVK